MKIIKKGLYWAGLLAMCTIFSCALSFVLSYPVLWMLAMSSMATSLFAQVSYGLGAAILIVAYFAGSFWFSERLLLGMNPGINLEQIPEFQTT
jgi:hypothetical protein